MSDLKMTADMKQAFLDMLEEVPNITAVRKLFGVGSSAVYRAKAADPEWAADVGHAINAGYDMMEEEARKRAVDGWNEPVYYRGEMVGEIRRYSDGLLKFLLTHSKPKKFNPGAKVSVDAGEKVKFVFNVGPTD
jgi:hypothetical protein